MLLLPLDVGNARDNSNVDMKIFWYIIYMAACILITIILPFGLFFYETDEENTFKMRLWTTVKYLVLEMIVVALILFCSFAGLRYA